METAWLPVVRSSLRPAHGNPGAWNSKSKEVLTESGSGFTMCAIVAILRVRVLRAVCQPAVVLRIRGWTA